MVRLLWLYCRPGRRSSRRAEGGVVRELVPRLARLGELRLPPAGPSPAPVLAYAASRREIGARRGPLVPPFCAFWAAFVNLAGGGALTATTPHDPLALLGIDHVELWVGNAKQAAHFYRTGFGFTPIAYAGPETGLRDRASWVLGQGSIR